MQVGGCLAAAAAAETAKHPPQLASAARQAGAHTQGPQALFYTFLHTQYHNRNGYFTMAVFAFWFCS
jgi:hypothetical protein